MCFRGPFTQNVFFIAQFNNYTSSLGLLRTHEAEIFAHLNKFFKKQKRKEQLTTQQVGHCVL